MGGTLSEPLRAKETSALENKHFKVGASCMQGWRVTMEDAHTHLLELKEDPDTAFFGVYDGHGGCRVAHHVSQFLHKIVLEREEYKKGDYKTALEQAFIEIDKTMVTDEGIINEMSGCTCNVAMLRKQKTLYVANVGDSRCIACLKGLAKPLSVDHKPGLDAEKKRIQDAGGYVEFGRVNGNLALSRALGDFTFKGNADLAPEDQIVSCFPDIVKEEVNENWFFLVLACDGIWDVLTNQEVADFICRRIGKNMDPDAICEEMMNRCLAVDASMGGVGCDNMSVLIVCFLHGNPYSQLVEKCRKYAEKLGPEKLPPCYDEDRLK